MVDEQDSGELTPEQESVVRRLLAEARHDEPIPTTVAARLDKVLDHLAAEGPGAQGGTAPVVDLNAKRRRRTAGRLMLAAAAVVVGGVALGQVLGDSGLAPSSDGDAGSAADTGVSAERNSQEADQPEDGALEPTQETAPVPSSGAEAGGGASADTYADLRAQVPVALSKASFDADVRRVYRNARIARKAIANQSLVDQAQPFTCPDAAYGAGLLLPAYLDGQPAVLAFRPPVGSRRVAELLECGTAEALDQLSLKYDPGN